MNSTGVAVNGRSDEHGAGLIPSAGVARGLGSQIAGAECRAKSHNATAIISEQQRDAHIMSMVAHVLEWNRLTPLNPIAVDVHEGHVTLTGSTYTQSDREEAEMLARRVPDVYDVDNKIEVLTDEDLSDLLKSAVVDALLRRTQHLCDGIGVHMKNGRVVLTGTVSSAAEKRLVIDTLRWNRNVMGIEDRLLIGVPAGTGLPS